MDVVMLLQGKNSTTTFYFLNFWNLELLEL